MTENAKPVIKQTPNKCKPSSLCLRLKNITTPQPFNLSSQDCTSKHIFGNQKRSLMKQELDDRKRDIEAEHLKQFRANPIPAHTFLPLFQQIQSKQSQKRQIIKGKIRAGLAKQKPFNLSCYRSLSVPDLRSVANATKEHFRAMPVPKKLNNKPLSEMLVEQEILREIRIKHRAEQFIKSSVLPFSTPHNAIKKHKVENACIKVNISNSTPTTPKPRLKYSDRTIQLEMPHVDKMLESSMEGVHRNSASNISETEHRRRSVSVSVLDCPTPRMTYGAILREQANRERYKERGDSQQCQLKKKKEGLVTKRDFLAKLLYNLTSTSKDEKLCRFREANQARMKEYNEEMQRMAERVKSRPYLIERQSQLSAINKLDRKFRETLQRQGLDEEFIIANSKGICLQNSSSDSSDENGRESTSSDDKNMKDYQPNTPSITSIYTADSDTNDESQAKTNTTDQSSNEKENASHTDVPEHDIAYNEFTNRTEASGWSQS